MVFRKVITRIESSNLIKTLLALIFLLPSIFLVGTIHFVEKSEPIFASVFTLSLGYTIIIVFSQLCELPIEISLRERRIYLLATREEIDMDREALVTGACLVVFGTVSYFLHSFVLFLPYLVSIIVFTLFLLGVEKRKRLLQDAGYVRR